MVNWQLINYIKSAEMQGYSSQQLYSYLVQQGYNANEVMEAINYANQPTSPQPQQTEKANKKPIIAIILIFILIIGSASFAFWFFTRPVCGNGEIEKGETPETCCLDAGCLGEQTCEDNICKEPLCEECQYIEAHVCKDYECCDDMSCSATQECKNHKCQDLKCGYCEYPSNHKCLKHECCEDTECNDNEFSTKDICSSNKCIHTTIHECINNDNYCPANCILNTDNDCEDNFYTYKSSNYGYSVRYPYDWNKEENLMLKAVIFKKSNLVNLNIIVQDLSLQPMSLDEFTSASLQQLQFITQNIVEQKKTTLSGSTAEQIIYTTESLTGTNKIMQKWTVIDNKAYILTFSSSIDQFDSNLATINQIIDSFSLIKKENIKPLEKPFLWKIKGQKDSYLYGTIHLTDERVLALPDFVVDAIKSSDTIYTEIILDQNAQLKAQEMSQLTNGQTLDKILPKTLYQRTDQYLKSKGLSITRLNNLKVWSLANTLTTLDSIFADQNKVALDVYISGIAADNRKEVGGLELITEQIEVFESLTTNEQITMLEDTLEYLEEYDKIGGNPSEELLDAYLKGDEELISYLIMESYDENDPISKKFIDLLFTQRNHKMTQSITEKIRENPNKSYFFTVGAGHYPGEDGILNLLREEGFTVERVTS